MGIKRIVTHDEALEAFRKMHDALYNGKRVPSLCVPPQPDDVDMVLCDYIDQQRSLSSASPVECGKCHRLVPFVHAPLEGAGLGICADCADNEEFMRGTP